MKIILSKLEKPYCGSSLAHIAVEVGEEEDIRLLVQSGSIDWNETAENEDPAIQFALKNRKFRIVDILMEVNEINQKAKKEPMDTRGQLMGQIRQGVVLKKVSD